MDEDFPGSIIDDVICASGDVTSDVTVTDVMLVGGTAPGLATGKSVAVQGAVRQLIPGQLLVLTSVTEFEASLYYNISIFAMCRI